MSQGIVGFSSQYKRMYGMILHLTGSTEYEVLNKRSYLKCWINLYIPHNTSRPKLTLHLNMVTYKFLNKSIPVVDAEKYSLRLQTHYPKAEVFHQGSSKVYYACGIGGYLSIDGEFIWEYIDGVMDWHIPSTRNLLKIMWTQSGDFITTD